MKSIKPIQNKIISKGDTVYLREGSLCVKNIKLGELKIKDILESLQEELQKIENDKNSDISYKTLGLIYNVLVREYSKWIKDD